MKYELLPNEEIKPIEGFPNYFITSFGRVWSELQGGRWLKPQLSQRGNHKRYYVNLGRDNRFYIHQLVAREFIPNPLHCIVVDHIDGDGLNNNVNNLRWVTQIENLSNPVSYERIQSNGGALVEIEEIATGKCFWGYEAAAEYAKCHKVTIQNHTSGRVKNPKWRLTGRKKSYNDGHIIE